MQVACGITLRPPVKACEIAVAQNGEEADFVPRGLDFWFNLEACGAKAICAALLDCARWPGSPG
jgi:hypothetical protein